MFTDEEIIILKEIANNYKLEQLKTSYIRQRALKWWESLRDECIGHSFAPAKSNYAYMYYKSHYSGLTEQQIIDMWNSHAIKMD